MGSLADLIAAAPARARAQSSSEPSIQPGAAGGLPPALEAAIRDCLRRADAPLDPVDWHLPESFKAPDAKQAFLKAFQAIGGPLRLAVWANEADNYPRFLQLFSKLIPTAVVGADGGALVVQVEGITSRFGRVIEQVPPTVVEESQPSPQLALEL